MHVTFEAWTEEHPRNKEITPQTREHCRILSGLVGREYRYQKRTYRLAHVGWDRMRPMPTAYFQREAKDQSRLEVGIGHDGLPPFMVPVDTG